MKMIATPTFNGSLAPDTKIETLIQAYPFLIEELEKLHPRFKTLRNPVMRSTLGKVATLRMAALIGELPVHELMMAVSGAVQREAGELLTLESGDQVNRDPRLEKLKGLILALHSGMELETAKRQFDEQFGDISSVEIAKMEQQLISEGLPAEHIQKLCDVHVGLFRSSLDKQLTPDQKPGHPAQTMREENAEMKRKTATLRRLLELDAELNMAGVNVLLEDLAEVEKHYLRKENELFPFLEKKDFNGPSQVMWAIHDEIRAELKGALQSVANGDEEELRKNLPDTLTKMDEMAYKEEAILLPTALELLEHEEWAAIYKQETELGFAWVERGEEWNPRIKVNLPPDAQRREVAAKAVEAHGGQLPPQAEPATTTDGAAKSDLLIDLNVGALTSEQINLMLLHLPVELSFVDENDEVRYYSGVPDKLFPRSPGVIGRKVQNCHPPKSLHLVNQILSEMKAGTRDTAEFWMDDFRGMFVHIRYDAVRDSSGAYRGCLESVQEIKHLRALEGSKRLLDEEAV